MLSQIHLSALVLDGIAVGSIFAIFFYWRWRTYQHNLPYPPGPSGLPIIGNLFQIPKENGHLVFLSWLKKYNSDIIHLSTPGKHLIVLNSLESAIELLDRRSINTCDRPKTVMINKLLDFWWSVGWIGKGPRLRDSRKASQCFNNSEVKKFRGHETTAVHDLLRKLLSSPDLFAEHIRHMAGRIILRLTYGFEVKSEKDHFIKIAERGVYGLSQVANTGSYLVDLIPILQYIPMWFPGAQFRKDAARWQSDLRAMKEEPFQLVQRARNSDPSLEYPVSSDSAAYSLLDNMMTMAKDKQYMEDVIKSSLGSFYGAGADTTISSLLTFILAMLHHPEIQEKAQAQIDSVVGQNRLPTFEDRESLPYIEAIVLETLRWHPVVLQNLPHALVDEEIFNGFYLPGGSIVIANIWAMSRDERFYPCAFEFNPGRFLDHEGNLNSEVLDPSKFAFGFGRRICPGRYLAKESVWLSVVTMLSTFHIKPKHDAHGKPIIPAEDYSSVMVRQV
ncbi:cytochrome P450 [Abortiporus biennis]|nr:cytochrome P450 [Abortiporus biennis]